jgi:hypothetical protein
MIRKLHLIRSLSSLSFISSQISFSNAIRADDFPVAKILNNDYFLDSALINSRLIVAAGE